jgi:hypothetical protein
MPDGNKTSHERAKGSDPLHDDANESANYMVSPPLAGFDRGSCDSLAAPDFSPG